MLNRQKSSSETVTTKAGRKQVFPSEVENDPAQQCRLMSFDLTMADGMHLAYLLALRNKITTNLFKRNETTERKWLKSFLRRHQEISATISEILHSQERGFTPESVTQYFLSLKTHYVHH
jgi:hypothetical protein